MIEIEVNGPANPRPDYAMNNETRKLERQNLPAYIIKASTLGEALRKYCNDFEVEIKPYDGKDEYAPLRKNELKYFYYEDRNSDRGAYVIDIHISKSSGDFICPKQNLEFKLEEGDKIFMGALIC